MATFTFQKPDKVIMIDSTDFEGKFEFRPLEPGYGLTVGNALRRVLLASLEGFAFTSVKIDNVDHEFTSLPGIVEDVTEIILNLKQVRLKRQIDSVDNETVTVSVNTQDQLKAGDLQKFISGFQILNPEQVICNMEKSVSLNFELNIEKGSEVLAAKLSTDVGRYDFAIQISKQASYEKRFYNKYNYPIINTPKTINNKTMPNQEVVLAIIRQESEFDRRANSWAGARGMMQLMKYTAKIVAKQAKLPYSISRLTKDPEYNIKLGSYYFNSLMEDYNGVFPFAIAAYNAGPNRVKTWRRINGDPSKGQLSYVNWIELIRFKETRNYVQRVLENINVYKYMLSKEPVKIDSFFN